MIKIFLATVVSLCITTSLFSMEKEEFMIKAIEKIKSEVEESKSFREKALCFQDLEKWYLLLEKLNIGKEEKREILKKTKNTINFLTESYQEFPETFFKDEKSDPLEITYQGRKIVVFHNLDKKRYSEELESYEKHRNFDPIEITPDTFKTLKTGTHYNYVVMPDNRLICGELQEYDEIFTADNKKILLAPNHAILAENNPVLGAGELKIIGTHEFPIFWIGTTSGHYHPSLDSKKVIERRLMEFGVPAEQIVTLGFHFSKLPWKFLEDEVKE